MVAYPGTDSGNFGSGEPQLSFLKGGPDASLYHLQSALSGHWVYHQTPRCSSNTSSPVPVTVCDVRSSARLTSFSHQEVDELVVLGDYRDHIIESPEARYGAWRPSSSATVDICVKIMLPYLVCLLLQLCSGCGSNVAGDHNNTTGPFTVFPLVQEHGARSYLDPTSLRRYHVATSSSIDGTDSF